MREEAKAPMVWFDGDYSESWWGDGHIPWDEFVAAARKHAAEVGLDVDDWDEELGDPALLEHIYICPDDEYPPGERFVKCLEFAEGAKPATHYRQ